MEPGCRHWCVIGCFVLAPSPSNNTCGRHANCLRDVVAYSHTQIHCRHGDCRCAVCMWVWRRSAAIQPQVGRAIRAAWTCMNSTPPHPLWHVNPHTETMPWCPVTSATFTLWQVHPASMYLVHTIPLLLLLLVVTVLSFWRVCSLLLSQCAVARPCRHGAAASALHGPHHSPALYAAV